MIRPSVRRIERLNYILGALLVLAGALTQPRPVALGIVVGVVLTCANFFVLRRLVTRWTSEAARGESTANTSFLMLPKMIVLMGAVAAAILLLPIDPLAFTIGYSTFIASIVIDCVYSAAFAAPAPEPDQPEKNSHG
jgi:hypothetical protein